MNFTLPEARRERMEQLLEYLGDTSRYSEYYKGNRAEDFKKCFDIESEWCCKYADIVLRGLDNRPVQPGDEVHHAVPRSFYGVKHHCNKIDAGNLFTLSYVEHVLAHYCLCYCATGEMRGKMVRAFMIMYRKGIRNKYALMPSEAELLDAIPEMEIKRIRAMEPRWAKVEADGRTHYTEDPKQYRKDYYEANRDKIVEHVKAYRESNREKIAEKDKAYHEANKEKIAKKHKAWYEANREKLLERNKDWYETNREKLLERNKDYYEANREKLLERNKAWRDVNKEKIAERTKAYREANREKLLERKKAYYEANREKRLERDKARYEANREKRLERAKAMYEVNKEKIAERTKAYREANKEKIAEYGKAWRDAKKAAGYRFLADPVTGKRGWVFVGLPITENAA